MAIIKHGDDIPVIDYYNDSEKEKCPKCGKNMDTIYVDKHENKLICIACESKGGRDKK